MNTGMRMKEESAIELLQTLLAPVRENGWTIRVNLHEDNTTAIIVAATGGNPTMKTLERGFGVSIAKLHEHYEFS